MHAFWLPFVVICAAAIVGAIAIVSGLALLFVTNTRVVTVIVESEAQQTRTDAVTVGELLLRMRINIGVDDRVTPPLDTPLNPSTIVRVERARTIFLQVDGDTRPWLTLLDDPADVLAEAGIRVDEDDRVIIDGTETSIDSLNRWPVPVSHIAVRHAAAVTVRDGSDQRLIRSTALTIGEALFSAGITLYTADQVVPPLDTPLNGDVEVLITRARPVTVIADGVITQVRVQGDRVADALVDAGVTLLGLDYTIPVDSAPLRPGMTVRVIRVSETVEIEEVPIAFETVYQADAALELDRFVTAQAGTPGVLHRRTQVRMENGAVISRIRLEDAVAQPAQPRVIRYGTNVVIRTLDTPDGVVEYWRVLPMWATSYHPAALGGSNITSTGRLLQKGIVGGDPRILPYGTRIYVAGYGVGEIADTGPPQRRRLWIDLGYSDHDWVGWARTVSVHILTPVPANIDYFLMQP
jgi:uncharacterized protein YabE (DUF348 family)